MEVYFSTFSQCNIAINLSFFRSPQHHRDVLRPDALWVWLQPLLHRLDGLPHQRLLHARRFGDTCLSHGVASWLIHSPPSQFCSYLCLYTHILHPSPLHIPWLISKLLNYRTLLIKLPSIHLFFPLPLLSHNFPYYSQVFLSSSLHVYSLHFHH